jgi:hypothetical protein
MRCQKGPSAEFNGRPAKKQARLDAGLGKLAVGWSALERRLAGRSELTRCGGGEKKARCGVEANERRFSFAGGRKCLALQVAITSTVCLLQVMISARRENRFPMESS